MPTFSQISTYSTEVLERNLDVNLASGLSEGDISIRRQKYGWNEITGKETKWWQLLGRQFVSPFIYLLAVSAALAFFLGEIIDGVMILLFVTINAFLGFYQEHRSEKTLELLKSFLVAKARVKRDTEEKIIESKDLVPGDIVILEPGDIIPADVRFIEETELMVDESILTGESVPIKKIITPLKKAAEAPFEALNVGFSGTTVVSGKALALVFATGRNTQMGNISKLTTETKRSSGFQKRILNFSKFILRLIVLTLVFVVIVNMALKKGQINFADMLIFAVALAVSVIPEALPVVTTFSLSGGALRLAKNKVVVKRLSAIEELGSVDVLCTDKTGTLTENQLKVANVFPLKKDKQAVDLVALAAAAAPFLHDKVKEPNNAFDIALWEKLNTAQKNKLLKCERLGEIPFDPIRRHNTVVIRSADHVEIIARGAAEEIMALCSLPRGAATEMEDWIKSEGRGGRRVIALAGKILKEAPKSVAKEEANLEFYGLISFIDPLKTSAKAALDRAKVLGVEVKILTGDSSDVAEAVGREVGLIAETEKSLTGNELDKMDYQKKLIAVKDYKIFARVSPEQKYEIIELLQKSHDVAFLGEGINDAPALKIANVGMVVAGASDIAREAADIVLLKNSLGVVINGIAEGRRIFANITKYIKITMASNLGNFYAIIIAMFMIDFLPMLPLQILLLNLLSDFPMIAIATDTVDAEELRKPKHYDLKDIILFSLILGLVSTVFDFIFFSLFYKISPEVLHTNWFIASVLTELALIYVLRSKKLFLLAHAPSRILVALTIPAACVALALPFFAAGRELFQFATPTFGALTLIVALVALYAIISEIVKHLYYRFAFPVETRNHTH